MNYGAKIAQIHDLGNPKSIMKRQQQIKTWLHSKFPDSAFNISSASADASFRRYFRATFTDHTLIVMDAPPKNEDCRPFIHIAQLFGTAGVHVPQVLAQDLEQGFLLLTDLGRQCTRTIRRRYRCIDHYSANEPRI